MKTGVRKVKFIAEKSRGEFEKALNKVLDSKDITVINIDYKPVTSYEYRYEAGDTAIIFTALVTYFPINPDVEV